MSYSNVLLSLQPYVKKKLIEYKKYGQESLVNPLFPGEQTAFEIYKHFLSALNFYTKEKFKDTDSEESQLDFSLEKDLTDQIIQYIDQVFKNFYQFEKELVHDLKEFSKREKFISIIIMHTTTHCGQALRLQAIYGRNFAKS